MKQLKALICALVTMCILCIGAYAAPRIPVYKINNTLYFFDKSTGTITGFAGEPKDLVIPDTIAGAKVLTIGDNAFYGSVTLRTLKIPEGINIISKTAFASCPNLTSVEIAKSVYYIGSGAFSQCKALTNVIFMGENTDFEPDSFYLTPWSEGNGAEFVIMGGKTLTKYNGKSEIVTVPAGVTKIDANAFAYNTTVKEVILPEGLQKIGDNAFVHCYSLEKINIPKTVSQIGAGAFDDTIWLKNQRGPYVCINGILINYRGNEAHIKVPMGVTAVGSGVFMSNLYLKSVILPESVIYIDRFAFTGCKNLLNVTIPDSVEWIDSFAFEGCDKLTLYGRENSYTQSYACSTEINFSTPVYVNVNGKSIFSDSVSPVIRYERTYVPLRDVLEALGFHVWWDNSLRSVYAKKGENVLAISSDGVFNYNGIILPTVAPLLNINSSTLVSVRVLADSLGAEIKWNDESRVVDISMK